MEQFEARESKQIAWARYDASTKILEVDFRGKNGAKASTYRYADFPPERWVQFQSAPSKGQFFAYQIRPNYKGVKIWDAKQAANPEPQKGLF